MNSNKQLPWLLALAASPAFGTVQIEGVEDALAENVSQYIVDEPACDAGAGDVREFVETLPARVRPALEGFGYYAARIEAEVVSTDETCWIAALRIEPGKPIEVADVSLEILGGGRDDPVMSAEIGQFPLPPGSVLDHGQYRLFKGRLEAIARERGYLDAGFTEERLDVFVDRGTAEIALTLDSGPRYSFGSVRFMTRALDESVLEDFVTFEPGDPYDASSLAELQRELSGSGYFASATVLPDMDAIDDLRVPVRVDAVPADPIRYSVGAGFSTDDGPRFRYSYENALRNTAGHQLDADLLLSQVRQNATFDYRIPLTHPQRDWLSFRAGVAREDIDAGVGAAARFGVRRTNVLDALTVTRYADVLVERDDIAGQEFTTRLLLPGMSWARSYRDDLVRPREGHRLSFGFSVGVGDLSLLQLDLRGKWIQALPWDGRFIVRGRLGTTIEDDAFDRVPMTLRFFAGGDNSVRGYDYQTLGPRNADGEQIGGNRLVEASVEYEHPVLEDWGVAVFVDAGNAFLDTDFDARSSVGIGARWFSPIGPIRLDIAVPTEALPGGDRSPRLHISLGPDL